MVAHFLIYVKTSIVFFVPLCETTYTANELNQYTQRTVPPPPPSSAPPPTLGCQVNKPVEK